MKPSNLKIAVFFFIFLALYGSYNVPGMAVQKAIQVVSTLLGIAAMVMLFRHPAEQHKRWLNIGLTILLAVTLIGFLIGQ